MCNASYSELTEAVGLVAHMRSTKAGLSDDSAIKREQKRLSLIASLHDLNLRHLERFGRHITNTVDFNAVRGQEEPSSRQYRDHFGNLGEALYEARILDVAYPEATSSMPVGQPKGQIRFTDQEVIERLADCIEDLGGIRPTERQIDNWRDGHDPAKTPGYARICTINGKRKGKVLDSQCDRAIELIRSRPDRWPLSYAIWSRIPRDGYVRPRLGEER